MKLASYRSQDRRNKNGELIVVSRDLKRAAKPESKAFTSLLDTLEEWVEVRPKLENIFRLLNEGRFREAFDFDPSQCQAPIAFAPGFFDGSAFLSHVKRARRARGDEMPESARITPLMYQGVADNALPATAPIDLVDLTYGGDFEGEFAVMTTFVPRATGAANCSDKIALVGLFNDITHREIVKVEIETKFGFLQSKPNNAFAPVVVTADELGAYWKNGRLELDLQVSLNGKQFGSPNGSEMNFSFMDLVAHACRTRPLSAGTIIGSGTVSNEDKGKGFACITELRFQEILDTGHPMSPWLKPGDRVEMEVLMGETSLFGKIEQIASL